MTYFLKKCVKGLSSKASKCCSLFRYESINAWLGKNCYEQKTTMCQKCKDLLPSLTTNAKCRVTKMLFLSAIIIIIICFICFRFHNFTFAFFDCNDYGLGIYLLKGLRRSYLDILRFESMYWYIQPWE